MSPALDAPPADLRSISEIADAAVSVDSAVFPAAARRVFALSLLDWSAVALAGRTEPVARILSDLAQEEAGAPQASLVGRPERVPARMAALANGTLSHALDYDDTHFLHVGHTSVAVVPAALAIAEKTGASGRAFLDAGLIGAEAACRVGAWLGRAHYQAGFHQTATSGAVGAALAAARLLGLSPEAARHALGVVATRASGLKSQFGTMGKPFNAGLAASNGVEAALLASCGFVSRPDGLDCVQGFADTHHAEGGDPAAALDGFGERFVFERVEHKLHACCHGLHAALEALGALRAERAPAPPAIRAIEIETNPRWLRVCDIAAPATGLEAKFSYRLTAAMALAGRDTAALETFSDAACADPSLLALRDRVSVAADPALGDTVARVRIRFEDGTEAAASHDLSAETPIEEREAKVLRKAVALVGEPAAERIRAAVAGLEEGAVEPFAAVLRSA